MPSKVFIIGLLFMVFTGNGYSQQPKLMFPIGHTDEVLSSKFSPDGRWIITQSADNTAKLWDASSGKLLRDFKQGGDATPAEILGADFTADGKKLVIRYANYPSKVWDIQLGKEWGNQDYGTENLIEQFSPDGNTVLLKNMIYSYVTKKYLKTLKEAKEENNLAIFSPDGKKIALVYDNNTLRIWDALTGKPITAETQEDNILSIEFTKDSKKILIITPTYAVIYDATSFASSVLLKDFEAIVQSGTFGYIKETIRLSPDGKKIIRLSGQSSEWVFRNYMSMLQYDTATIWDAQTGNLLFRVNNLRERHSSSFFSPDARKIILISSDSMITIRDAVSGSILFELKGHQSTVTKARFSPDGKIIISASKDRSIKIWNAVTGKLINELNGHKSIVNDISYNKDGTRIVSASGDLTAKIWDPASGKELAVMKGHTIVAQGDFTKNGKGILFNTQIGMRFLDVEKRTAKIVPFNSIEIVNTGSLVDESGYVLGSGSPDSTILIVNAVTVYLKNIKTNRHYSFDFDREEKETEGQVKFSPDSKKIVFNVYEDQTTRVFDIETGKLLLKIILIDSSDFLIADSSNRYDGTEAARKLLYFTCGSEIIELSQVKDQLWVPGLAERILAGYKINAVTFDQLNICNKAPLVEDLSSDSLYRFRIVPKSGGIGKTVVGLNGYEYKEFEKKDLFKNGNNYEINIPKSQLKPFFEAEADNTVWVKSSTAAGDMPSRVLSKTESLNAENKTPPNLFAVMVGTSNYKDDRMDLQFAASDAVKMGVVLGDAATKLLGKKHVFIYTVTTEDKSNYPEKAKIREILLEIGKRANPNDILLIFLSGHGVMHEKTKEFYYLTADAGSMIDETLFKTTGVSMTELTDWIKPQNMKARKRVLILDACQSGQAINNLLAFNRNMLNVKGDEEARQIKAIEKLNERSGLYILSASTSTQSAYESEEYGHGYLTYSLLKGIKENPAILEEGKYLNISRWFNEAAEMVSELSEKDQSRQEPQVVSTSQFNIGLVDQELIQKIQLLSPKPLFVTGNFMNRDEAVSDDNLGIRKLVDKDLQRLSAEQGGKKIVFSTQSTSPDAYFLNGTYLIREKEISFKIRLKKGDATLYAYDLKGDTDQLLKMVNQITEQAINWIRKQKGPANQADNE